MADDLPAGPECPPWCTDHSDIDGDHRNTAEQIRLSGPEDGYARVTIRQSARFEESPRIHVFAGASLIPTEQCALVKAGSARDVGELALLLDRLADATPEQMRDLAAQLRSASALVFGGEE